KIGVFESRGGGHATWNCHAFHANSEFYADFGRYEVDLTAPADYVIAATGKRTADQILPGGKRRLHYSADRVHDFAWVAGHDLVERRDHYGNAEILWLGPFDSASSAERQFRAAKQTLAFFARIAFPYPYPTLTLIEPPPSALGASGMEYPTLVTTIPSTFVPMG